MILDNNISRINHEWEFFSPFQVNSISFFVPQGIRRGLPDILISAHLLEYSSLHRHTGCNTLESLTHLQHGWMVQNIMTIFASLVSGKGNIFGSVCVSVCVCLFALCRLNRWTNGPKIWHTHWGLSYLGRGEGHRSKVKVTKVKNVKILVFSLVSQKVVLGQGQEGQGQGHKGQGQRSRS